MEKASFESRTSTSIRAQLDDDGPPNRLIEIADSFPDNLIVRYFVAPVARHFWKSLLALLIFIYGSLITCNFWNDEKICDRRFNSLVFFVGLGIFVLIGYTSYLRRKLERQKQLSQEV